MSCFTTLKYDVIREQVLFSVKAAIDNQDVNGLFTFCRQLIDSSENGTDADIKVTVDTAFRDVLHEFIEIPNCETVMFEALLDLSIKAVRKDISSGNLPVLLLTDIFDCKTLAQCEKMFEMVENRVKIWKEEAFFNNVKNQMLRSCNDLLRRLSRSQNTIFGGRILEFLARFFPLFERSGLNITSEFNQDSIISISMQDEGVLSDNIVSNDLEEGEMPSSDSVTVDYNLYRKFWHLQEFFRSPNLCYSRPYWKQFQSYTNDVLSAFTSCKLDSMNVPVRGLNGGTVEEKVHFTKYLTNQKLLELQFSDSNFRRYIFIQFLILFQYLTAYVKSRHESHTMSEGQNEWIKESTERILRLIEESPSNGIEMRNSIEHILKREEYWSAWKNETCPNLKSINEPVKRTCGKKRKLGEEIRAAANSNKVMVGNAELSKLWNLCQDNWEACLSKRRIFTPTVDKYFENMISFCDDSEERQKKISENCNFSWRALRLLSAKSPYFFTPSNQMVKPISEYLDSVIEKIGKDLAAGSHKLTHELAIDDAEDISNDELLKQVDDNSNLGPESSQNDSNDKSGDVPRLDKILIEQIANKIKDDWKKIARLLKLEEDEIEFFESQSKETATQAKQMLTIWMEKEDPEDTTLIRLQEIIDRASIDINLS